MTVPAVRAKLTGRAYVAHPDDLLLAEQGQQSSLSAMGRHQLSQGPPSSDQTSLWRCHQTPKSNGGSEVSLPACLNPHCPFSQPFMARSLDQKVQIVWLMPKKGGGRDSGAPVF